MRRLIPIFIWLFLTIPCSAEIIIVDDDWPFDFDNVQAAIDYSTDGDIIVLFPGTYTGEGNYNISFGGKAITVRSVDPGDPYIVAATIIDCNGSEEEYRRGFYFAGGEDANSILDGLTITNGYADGGAIYCGNYSSPAITNCTISENTAKSVRGDGRGGGIYCGYYSSPAITNCTITGNIAGNDGGGIYCGYYSSPTITNCIITSNSADLLGGGIYCSKSSPKITNCTISGNTTVSWWEDGLGGGMYCNDSIITLTNCTFSGNSADSGGGIYFYDSWSTITNCTISSNSAGTEGGGIFCYDNSYHKLVNCILWGNTDSSGVIEAAQINCWYTGVEPVIIFSCIQDDDPNDAYIPVNGANHNIDDNPVFVRNPSDGGDGWGDDPQTPGIDEGANDDFGDLHLQPNSPCINTGVPNPSAYPNRVDMDGQPRVMGLRVDMGADEFFMPMIIVTRPQAGIVWVSGSTHKIKWDSYVYAGTVDILFSKDSGGNWQSITGSAADTGSYTWHLPDIVDSNQCLISVVPAIPDANVVCIESGLFTIHPDSPGPAVESKWESLGGDFDRAGLSENYGPELGCVKWQFETDGAVSASVTVGADNRVHIPCEDGKVYTLDADGVLLWSYDANSPLLSSPTIGPDGTVYVGAQNAKLYAIDIDGNLRWTHSADGIISSSPAVSADGKVYACSQDGTLYALASDGSELWSFETDSFVASSGGSIFASPAIGADGTVYIAGLYDPNLYALDANDGSLKWACRFDSNGWPFASPVIAADGTIYQTLVYDSNLYAIDPNRGRTIWETDLAGTVVWFGHPPDGYYLIWYGPGEPPVDDPDSPFFRGHIEDKYRYSYCWSEPALAPDGTIYVSFDDPYLRAVEPDGSIKWVSRLGMMGGFTLTVGSDGLIYAASDDGCLCVVNPDGEEIARFQSDDWLNFPVIAADNTIIVSGSKDNTGIIGGANNTVWAIGGDDCEGEVFLLHRPQDLNADRAVNNIDFALLAADWLGCTDTSIDPETGWPRCDYDGDEIYFTGDIDRNLYVDLADLAALAQRWLSEE